MSDVRTRIDRALPRLVGMSIGLVLCGCAGSNVSPKVVRGELEDILSGPEAPEMVAAVLSERRDCVVTVTNAATTTWSISVRYVVGDAARCDVTWFRDERRRTELVYEVPGAGTGLRALYRLFQHAPEELNPHPIFSAASAAHLTTGNRWRFSPIGTVKLRSFPYRVCEQPYCEGDSPESMRRDLRRDLCETEDFSEQGLNDLLICLFDDACLEWQATHRPGTSPIADWNNEDTSTAEVPPGE